MTNKLIRAVEREYLPGRPEVPPTPGYCYTEEKQVLTGYEYPPRRPLRAVWTDGSGGFRNRSIPYGTYGIGGGIGTFSLSGGGSEPTPLWGAGVPTPLWAGGVQTGSIWGGGAMPTPLWSGSRGRTSAWGGGSDPTPLWGGGSDPTPLWSGSGGSTPLWDSGSGPTPLWGGGTPTPIYGTDPDTGERVLLGHAPMRNAPPQPKYVTHTEKTCVPAKPGIPGIPEEIILHNAGPDWLASARSITSVAGGAQASFDLPEKPRVMIGFAVHDSGAEQSDIRMGIYTVPAEPSGIDVFPILNGEVSTTSFHISSGARITLLRHKGAFTVLAGGVEVYSTAVTTEEDVFLDAMLYTATDYVDNPVLTYVETITTVSVTGSVGLRGQVGSVVDGRYDTKVRGAVGFSGGVYGTASSVVSVHGSVGIRAARAFYGDLYEPKLSGGYLVMPSMKVSGVVLTSAVLWGEVTLPRITGLAADRPYAEVRGQLRPLWMYADAGWVLPNYYGHNEPLVLWDAYALAPTLVAVFVDNLGVAMEMSLAVIAEGAFFDGALLADGLSVHALVELLVKSGLTLTSATQLPHPELAQLAFNTEAGAATRYEGFGFTGFVYTDEGTFAVKPDGVYRLRQGDDDGATRSALVEFGAASFGGSQKKHIHTMYLGTGGDGTLYVKLSPDGRGYKTYRVVGQKPTQRVHTGKGLTAREWTLRLEWVDMAEAELDSVEFVIAGSSRRWVR